MQKSARSKDARVSACAHTACELPQFKSKENLSHETILNNTKKESAYLVFFRVTLKKPLRSKKRRFFVAGLLYEILSRRHAYIDVNFLRGTLLYKNHIHRARNDRNYY